jgi:pyruvate carboxylase subunit B
LVDGERFEAAASDALAVELQKLTDVASPGRASIVAAPMPGLVIRVNVSVGDTVAAGQGLVVMEAMKMENELKATGAGVVARVHVTAGVPVEKGALLVEIERALSGAGEG